MNKFYNKDSRKGNRLSESISKRNYSANVIGKFKYQRQFKGVPQSNIATKPKNIINNIYIVNNNKINLNNEKGNNYLVNNMINETSRHISENNNYNNFNSIINSKANNNNLEKFLFLNQQFKQNDLRKKNINRKITSAEPNVLKTKISQNLENAININNNKFNNTIKENNFFSNKKNSKFVKLNSTLNNKENINIKNFNNVFNNNNNNGNNLYNINSNNNTNNRIKIKANTLNNKLIHNEKIKIAIPSIINNNNALNFNLTKGKFFNFNNKCNINNKQVKKINSNNNKPYIEYYVQLTQNSRDTMEDFHLINEIFNKNINESLFALFDGHGGVEVAQKLKNELHERFENLLIDNNKNNNNALSIESLINKLYLSMDEDIVKQFTVNTQFESTNFISPGSTCTMLYMSKNINTNNTYLYCSNVGDTKGLLIKKDKVVRITYEHKPSDEHENKRVKSNDGVIFGGRIFGQFMLTRAFGNTPLKKWVTAEPYISKNLITEDDRYAVIASDGIWDVITEDDCFDITNSYSSCKDICNNLVSTAIARWSKDNISCIVVKLNDI